MHTRARVWVSRSLDSDGEGRLAVDHAQLNPEANYQPAMVSRVVYLPGYTKYDQKRPFHPRAGSAGSIRTSLGLQRSDLLL